MRFLAIIAVLTLCGCSSMKPADLALADNNRCIGYGFKPGTDAYAQCRMQVDQQRVAANRETIRRITSNTYTPLPTPVVPTHTNCTSTMIGNTMQTQCR